MHSDQDCELELISLFTELTPGADTNQSRLDGIANKKKKASPIDAGAVVEALSWVVFSKR